MATHARARSLFDRKIVGRAIGDSFLKLNPRTLLRNPVMFVVEIVAAATTIFFVRDLIGPLGAGPLFTGQIAAWLWFTVLFANLAEAMAEGRGKAQAESLRRTKTQTMAKRLHDAQGSDYETVPATSLRRGDIVIAAAGDIIPGDGEIIEGVASVDESAITGESAPVIRESGGDRSAVTGGTRVISDWIKIRITSNPGETFLDRMIALVEGANRQKTRAAHMLGGDSRCFADASGAQ
jgi:K+-transporting ATPase ATPase B chain